MTTEYSWSSRRLSVGAETVMPNWALKAMESLTLASDIKLLCFLVRHQHYRDNTFSKKQLAIALELHNKTVQQGIARLEAQGYVLTCQAQKAERHCAPGATSKLILKQSKVEAGFAQTSHRPAAVSAQIYSRSDELNAVSDAENHSLNKGSKEGKNINNIMPVAQESGDALSVVVGAGGQKIWDLWCSHQPQDSAATRQMRLAQWSDWVQAGHAEALWEAARSVVEDGTSCHFPFKVLRGRMNAHIAGQQTKPQQVQISINAPLVLPGERRRTASGKVWTVDFVEDGIVHFVEPGAPLDQGERHVARWAQDGVA